MLIFKKKEKVKVHKRDKRIDLKKHFIANIVSIAKSSAKEEHKLDKLSLEIIDFFKNYYGIRHEFTFEELECVLEEKKMGKVTKIKLQNLLANLSTSMYSEEIAKKSEDITKDLLDVIPKI